MASNRFDVPFDRQKGRPMPVRSLPLSPHRSRSGSRAGVFAAAVALVTLALAACGSSGGGSSNASPGGKKDYQGKTLTLWHYEAANSAMGIAWNQAIKDFKAKYPGVKVKFEPKGFEQIQKNANMILNSDSAPDILEYNKGNGTAGLLSKLGLLSNMTDVVHNYGWDKKLSASLQTTARYTKGVMGSGDWYGVPNYGEYVMVYYNKKLFTKYGVQVPKTFDQFVS